MFPVLFSFGPLHIFSFSIFFIFAWIVFSFYFWKRLRDDGIDEEKIFDLTFAISLAALVFARLWFVLTHWDLFQKTLLKIVTLWVQPGLDLTAGLVGALLVGLYLCKRLKVKSSYFIDALARSFPVAMFLGLIGALLDGSSVGIKSSLPWAVSYIGHAGARHPVQVYELLALVLFTIFVQLRAYRGVRRMWDYGSVGLLFLIYYGIVMFCLELIVDSHVYWYSLTPSQWLWLGVIAETIGVVLVRAKVISKIKFKFASISKKGKTS